MALQRGADAALGYDDFVTAVRDLTAGEGAQVIFDPVGGEVMVQSLRAVAWGGRLLVVGFAGGSIPDLAANRILLKSCAVLGVRAGEAGRRDPAILEEAQSALLAHAEAGRLKPHISTRLPLEHFAEGMRLLMERQAIGRVVLTSGR